MKCDIFSYFILTFYKFPINSQNLLPNKLSNNKDNKVCQVSEPLSLYYHYIYKYIILLSNMDKKTNKEKKIRNGQKSDKNWRLEPSLEY